MTEHLDFHEQIERSLADNIERKLRQERLPGLAIGVVLDQELVWSGGFGYADPAARRQPNADTISRVASITKTLTATAILQLRDEGLLSLDDPLAQHLPEFANAQPRAGSIPGVTIRRLLTHRSGLTTESPLPSWADLNFPSREAILAALPDTEVVIPQDSAFKYSNLAFAFLGEVVSRAAARPFVDYMQAEILGPLGMTSTVFELNDDLRPRFAVGYSPSLFEDELHAAPYVPLNGMSACGQLHSTVSDLAKWISQQFRTNADRGTSQVLNGSTLEEMHRPQYLEPDWSAGYCLGWRAIRVGNEVFLGHGGGIHGFASQILFSKPHQVGVICLANIWPYSGILDIAQDVIATAVSVKRDLESPVDAKVEPVGKTPNAWKKLLGTYIAAPGIPATIEFRDGDLWLCASPLHAYSLHAPTAIDPTETENRFRVRSGRAIGESAVFRTGSDGLIAGFDLGGFRYDKLYCGSMTD